VGKTTIACALIRALNKAGTPTAGFKPYGAMMIVKNAALLEENLHKFPCRVYGADSLRLTKASPLTSMEMIDVVGPSQFLCYSGWPNALVARTGSIVLNNVEYFKSGDSTRLEKDADTRELIERTGLPLGKAKPLGLLNFFRAPALSPEKQKLAFDHLVRLGAASIVCEGTGRSIPNWQDCPGVNHVICIAERRVTVFPDVDLRVTFSRDSTLVPASELTEYLDRLGKPRYVASLAYVAEDERRDEAADGTVAELLTKAGRPAVVG
jgi:hypothetical protein